MEVKDDGLSTISLDFLVHGEVMINLEVKCALKLLFVHVALGDLIHSGLDTAEYLGDSCGSKMLLLQLVLLFNFLLAIDKCLLCERHLFLKRQSLIDHRLFVIEILFVLVLQVLIKISYKLYWIIR